MTMAAVPSTSASAGGSSDLPQLERELKPKTVKPLDSMEQLRFIDEGKKAIIKLNKVNVKELDHVQIS